MELHNWHCLITYHITNTSQCQLCSFVPDSISLSRTGVSMPFVHEHNANYAITSIRIAQMALCHYIRVFAELANAKCAVSSQIPSLYRGPVCQCHLCMNTMPNMQSTVSELHKWHCGITFQFAHILPMPIVQFRLIFHLFIKDRCVKAICA